MSRRSLGTMFALMFAAVGAAAQSVRNRQQAERQSSREERGLNSIGSGGCRGGKRGRFQVERGAGTKRRNQIARASRKAQLKKGNYRA